MVNNRTIFFVNSMGFMAQWRGEIINMDETSISIRFSKNKALRYNLKSLDIDFCLVTNTVLKDIGVCISKASEAVQFDDRLKAIVLEKTKGNVQALWSSGQWQINNKAQK